MRPVAEHLRMILGALTPIPAYDHPLLECLGLPVAEDVAAPISLPTFDNSAMDGYAVAHPDVATASQESPIHLPVVGEIGAGTADVLAMSPGTAVKIMTGAAIPQGCTAVVPYEWTDRGVAQVRISRAPTEGQNIRRTGEDVEAGEVVVSEGTVLDPRHLGLLAAVGRPSVRARPRPRVVVLSTGAELREPGTPLARDAVYDSNSYMLAAAVRVAGGIAYRARAVADDPGEFVEALSDQLVRADIVVTTGGVSQGDFDVVKEALSGSTEMGRVRFGNVAMQPGKPQAFGLLGEDRVPFFGLPGNPVSAYVSFQVFVLPALRKLQGRTPVEPVLRQATCTHGFTSPEGKQQFVRGSFAASVVSPVGGHGSHLLGDLAESNALIVVPEETTRVTPGDTVHVMLLDEDSR